MFDYFGRPPVGRPVQSPLILRFMATTYIFSLVVLLILNLCYGSN